MQLDQPITGALVGSQRRAGRGDPSDLGAGLSQLIERRAQLGQEADEREESWKESVRQYHAENREAFRYQWITYYRTLAGAHRRLSEENEKKALALLEPTS